MTNIIPLRAEYDRPIDKATSAVYMLTDSIEQITELLIKHPHTVFPHINQMHNELIELAAIIEAMRSGKITGVWA